jgi:hypothetical protein
MSILQSLRQGWHGPDTPALSLDQLGGQLLGACNTAWQLIGAPPHGAPGQIGHLHCQIAIPVQLVTPCPAHASPQAIGLRLLREGGPWALRLARWLRRRWSPLPCTQLYLTVDYDTPGQTARVELRLGKGWCRQDTVSLHTLARP